MDSKQPLGLPVGSVRAFLAVSVTATFCVLAATGRPLPPDLVRLVEMAFSGYLLMRATQWQAPKNGQPPTPADSTAPAASPPAANPQAPAPPPASPAG